MLKQKVFDNVFGANMWYLICFIVILAAFVKILSLYFQEKRKRILASEIPGPTGAFLIGSLSLFMEGPEKLITNIRNLYRMYENSLFKFWILNELYIVITQPEDIKFVLTNPKVQKKSKIYEPLEKSVLGQGLITINDIEKWKINRKAISVGLNFTNLKSFILIFYEEANVLSEILRKNCANSNECDIIRPINMATFDIIRRATLNISLNAQKDGHDRMINHIEALMNIFEYRVLHPWYLNETLNRFSSVKTKQDRHQKIVNELIDEIISKKFNEYCQNNNTNRDNALDKDDGIMGRKPQSIIEILLRHPEMSFDQIREEVLTIIFAGQDTTAFTIACAIFLLAHHQEIQKKVYEEVESIFSIGVQTRCPTYEDLQQMKYLEQVIKETLRIFPAGLFFARKIEEDIRIGKHLCPADSTIVICPVFLQTSPLYYTNPDTFNPDNFLPDACLSRNPYTFMAFSGGPRNCIGSKYAMCKIKTILSTLVRANKFLPSNRCPTMKHLRLKFTLTQKFVDGCHVKIEPRT